MLYLVSTPIGNLQDITLRALQTLKECDYILCEDTRHSIRLLQHFEIEKKLVPYHKFNEAAQEETLLTDLSAGLSICLLSDAGTPTIADPGQRIVARCIEAGLPVTALPGPCAVVTALSLSGLATNPFQFVGFIPKKEGQRKELLLSCIHYTGTSIAYETPHRLLTTLQALREIAPKQRIALAKELTKLHERLFHGTVESVLEELSTASTKGEWVMLIEGGVQEEHTMTVAEHVEQMQETFGVTQKEAIRLVAQARNQPKRAIYNAYHGL